MSYDSRTDTALHILNVAGQLKEIIENLEKRRREHDKSKLQEPEKSMYDEFTPKLRGSTYGSDEYKGFLKDMGAALQHHYAENSHHPEHYENGINGMSLLDLIEMLADWKAAGMRHADGNIMQSMEINRKRFGMSDQLYEIFVNTVKELGW
jgi:hypothetical protein